MRYIKRIYWYIENNDNADDFYAVGVVVDNDGDGDDDDDNDDDDDDGGGGEGDGDKGGDGSGGNLFTRNITFTKSQFGN